MGDRNKPTEPGYYWARRNNAFRWWNLIVRIHGERPYLSFMSWDILDNKIEGGADPSCFDFGPRIDDPASPDWRA